MCTEYKTELCLLVISLQKNSIPPPLPPPPNFGDTYFIHSSTLICRGQYQFILVFQLQFPGITFS